MSLNNWLTARGAEYSAALTQAKAAYDNDPTSPASSVAYAALVTLSDDGTGGWNTNILNSLRTGTTAESEITLMQEFLADSADHAAALGLAVQTAVDTGARTGLGGLGVEGGQYRRWKGQPLYTFGNGLLVGKNNQLIAAFGDHPIEIAAAGFGTDGLIFFDGKPMSKNTTTPGTVVFGGDLMVSGSIRGDAGVVIIDDVIQLETGVANPAGIALDSSGQIKLRHRGQGFTQFIDPALTQAAAENAAKIWVSEQNTNATRLSDSIIPNSNFDTKEYFLQSSTYYSRPAGVAAVGTEDKTSISYPTGQPGVLKMNPDSDSTFGFVLPAVDVSEGGYEGKFNIKIRYSSDSSTTISQGATSGIFIYACETNASPTQFADKKYVYDTTNPTNNLPITAVQESRNDYYEADVTFTALTSPSLDIPANGTWNVQSYDFTKQSTTTYVSILVFVQNIGTQSLFVDYVSMKPIQVTESQISGLVSAATNNISTEAGSILQNASLISLQSEYDDTPEYFIKSKTAAGASYAAFAEAQGDNYSSDNTDKGVSITAAAGQSNVGMISKTFDRDALLYTVGARVKALADGTTYRIVAIESNFDTSGVFMDANAESYNLPYDAENTSVNRITDSSADTANGALVGIKVAELQSDGTYNQQDTDPLTVTKDISDGWITLLGTYKPTRTTSGTDSNVRKISLMVEITSAAGSIAVDFLYVQRQTSTADIAETLADEAYSDAQSYVSVLNSFVAKEQGSLIPNAQMGVQEFIIGSGSTIENHIRPSGFKYVGINSSANSGSGDGYLLSYAPESAALGKDAVMKIELGGTTDFTKGFTTPPFPVGTDRYSVIIRGQRVSSAGTIRAGINYTNDTLETGKGTIAGNSPITVNSVSKSVTYESDVQTGASVIFQELELNDNTMYSSMTNHIATWDLVGSDLANPNIVDYADVKLASLTVLASQDFYIDYLYIVPQTISSNIATLNDNSIRNFFNEINELGEQENDSLIGNGNFTVPKASDTAIPSNWYPTAGTTFQFIQHSSSGNTATYIDPDTGGSNVTSLNGNGTMVGVKYTPGSGCRVYSGILNLPNQLATTYTDSDGNTVTPSSTGQKYTVFAKVRTHSGSGNKARIQLKYHDTTASITNETHIYDNTLASSDSASGKSDAAGGQTGNIDCVNITAGTDDGSAAYEDILSTSWQTVGGTYTARSTAKHVSFSIDITFPDGGQPTANSVGSEPTTFFYIDYFYVGIQTMTTDIAIALAQAESDIAISPLQISITDLENSVELEDPSLSLITNSTFANLYDTSNPDIAKYWVATRSTKNAVEVYPNGTGGIASIGTHATPYNATGDADNNYGMLSKLVVEPALAVTTHSFDALGLSTSSLGKYNIIVRCRGTGSALSFTNIETTTTSMPNDHADGTSNSKSAYNFASFTDSSTSIAIRGRGSNERYWVFDDNPSSEELMFEFADITSSNSDLVYFYFGMDWHSYAESTDDFDVIPLDGSDAGITFDSISIHHMATSDDSGTLSGQSWTAMSNSSTTKAEIVNTGDAWNTGRIVRLTFTGANAKNIRKIKIDDSTSGTMTTYDYLYVSMPIISYRTAAVTNPFSAQIIAHEKYTALAANATHVIDASVSVTSLSSNIGSTLDTFTNNNVAGKSTALNAIDLGNSGATASTTQNVTADTHVWRNVLATYTPDPRAHAVSFEFKFDSDQDTDGTDAIVYVDSVHMEVSTADQDLVIALANERAETAETNANNAAISQGSAAQQAAALILAAAQSEAAQSRDNINASVSSEQGSIMYNSAFAYSNVYGASDGGVTTSKSGAMTVTINSTNATKQGQYKIEMTSTGSTSTTSGGIVIPIQAKYKLYKHNGSSFVTIKNPSTGSDIIFDSSTNAVPLHDTGITIAWNQVHGAVIGDNYTWTTTVQQRPIGYRLGRVAHTPSAYLIRNNLHYNELPDSTAIGGAKIQISENRTGGVDLSGAYSLLCPPVLAPSDGQKTGYEVAVKLKSESGDSSQTIGIRIHELYDYFDQDTYVTFCANKSNAKNLTIPLSGTFLDDAGATISNNTPFNIDQADGIDDGSNSNGNSTTRETDTDVYMFPPSNRDLPKRTVINGWSGYDSTHEDWPLGSTQDVAVLKLSEFDTSPGTTENYGTSFVTIGGGFDTKEDTKAFVVELIFTNVDNAKSTIIDYIHVAPSTLGSAAAGAIATTNAQAQVSVLLGDGICSISEGGPYTTQSACESAGGTWTSATAGATTLLNYLGGGKFMAEDAVASDITTAKSDVTQQVANMKTPSLQTNGTFSNWLNQNDVPGWSGGSSSTKFPVGYSLHRKTNANHSSYRNTTSDERNNIQYDGTYNVDDPRIKIVHDSDTAQSLVCPYILNSAWGGSEGLSFAISLASVIDTNVDLYVRCHQMFSTPVGQNGTGTSAQCDSVLQNGTYSFTANSITYDDYTDLSESTANNRSPSAAYFTAIDPRATKASAVSKGASGLLGTTYTLNLINLLDESVTAATSFIDDFVGSTSTYYTFGGSCPIHPDAIAVSFEVYFNGIGGDVLIEEISVQGMETWIDIAHLKAADRVLNIADDIEEEEAAQLTNVILNPKGTHSYKPNSRYEVPRNWRYLGEQPYGVGYRTSTTGTLLDKPLPRGKKLMSMGIIGERGIAQRNSSNYINHGIVSKPWRVEDDMYEWEIDIQLSNASGYDGVRIFILEYDTATKPQWLKPRYAKAWNSTIDATTMYGGGTAVASTRQVCLHHNAEDLVTSSGNWSTSSQTSNNGVEYDLGQTDLSTYNITRTKHDDATVGTITSDQEQLLWNDSNRYKFEGTYIPKSTTKYAALWITTFNGLSKLTVYNAEMNSDKTSTAAISLRNTRLGLAEFAGKTATSALSSRFSFADIDTQVYGGLSFTFTLLSFPTSPFVPSIDASEVSVADGFSGFTSTSESSSTVDNRFDVSLKNTNSDTTDSEYDRPSAVKYTYQSSSGNRTKKGGLLFGREKYYYNRANLPLGASFGDTGPDRWVRGVSHFVPEVSENVGIDYDNHFLWIKPSSDDSGGIKWFANDSLNDWHVFFDDSYDTLDFQMDGTLYGFVDNDNTGTSNDGDKQMNFTGQHNCAVAEIQATRDLGLIVVSSGTYKNMGGNKDRSTPSINESLPIVSLSTKRNQKSCFGVVSNEFDDNGTVRWKNGNWGSVVHLVEEDKGRVAINSLGEGGIWICNINGNLENGDYITTCEIPGHGMLQDDDLLHNYTVAKITQDCVFELDNPMYDCIEFEHEGNTYRKAFVGCTYHCG